MLAMDDFITIGTQMKIERPGKACAIAPCDDSEGPWVVLKDGRFIRLDDMKSYSEISSEVKCVWDNGELVVGLESSWKITKIWFLQFMALTGGLVI